MQWPLLEAVPEADVRRTLEMARRRVFARDEVVFHQDDPADTIHLIESGHFAVRASTRYGQRATLAILGAGEAFGELALLDPGAPRSATVVALESAVTHSIHQLDFNGLRQRHPETATVLIAILTAQVRRLSAQLLEALYAPAESRVRRRVAELARRYEPSAAGIVIPLRQEDLAELAGTSRGTVNRVLREEERRGTVRLSRGRTIVLDAERLLELAG